MKAATSILTLSMLLFFLCTPIFSEPEKMTEDQMTEINVQEGIKTLDGADTTKTEGELLENLASPVPGTGLETTNTNPIHDTTQIELDNLNNQQNQQNIQEQFSEHLFDQVIENSNQ